MCIVVSNDYVVLGFPLGWVGSLACGAAGIRHGRLSRVDPVTLIAGAVAAGAAAGAGDTAKQVVVDAYAALKGLITHRYGVVEAEVVGVEFEPEEPLRRQLLAKRLAKTGAGDDEQLQAAAQELLRIIEEQVPAVVTAVGMRLTRAAVGGDFEVSDLVVNEGSGFEGTDVTVDGSFKFTGGRVGRPSTDPSAAHG